MTCLYRSPKIARLMFYRLSIVAIAVLSQGPICASAKDLPIFEVSGLPATPHQLAVLGVANAEEALSAPSQTVAGMPASPHQLAVLAAHKRWEPLVAGELPGAVKVCFPSALAAETSR